MDLLGLHGACLGVAHQRRWQCRPALIVQWLRKRRRLWSQDLPSGSSREAGLRRPRSPARLRGRGREQARGAPAQAVGDLLGEAVQEPVVRQQLLDLPALAPTLHEFLHSLLVGLQGLLAGVAHACSSLWRRRSDQRHLVALVGHGLRRLRRGDRRRRGLHLQVGHALNLLHDDRGLRLLLLPQRARRRHDTRSRGVELR
mmetsp:Transcript_83138/g.243784  ORF Transcript_83138/g.243784 Transcript_83138/m.243784 type:complete len:200 (-) Transcript_83138:1535-2134(-)